MSADKAFKKVKTSVKTSAPQVFLLKKETTKSLVDYLLKIEKEDESVSKLIYKNASELVKLSKIHNSLMLFSGITKMKDPLKIRKDNDSYIFRIDGYKKSINKKELETIYESRVENTNEPISKKQKNAIMDEITTELYAKSVLEKSSSTMCYLDTKKNIIIYFGSKAAADNISALLRREIGSLAIVPYMNSEFGKTSDDFDDNSISRISSSKMAKLIKEGIENNYKPFNRYSFGTSITTSNPASTSAVVKQTSQDLTSEDVLFFLNQVGCCLYEIELYDLQTGMTFVYCSKTFEIKKIKIDFNNIEQRMLSEDAEKFENIVDEESFYRELIIESIFYVADDILEVFENVKHYLNEVSKTIEDDDFDD